MKNTCRVQNCAYDVADNKLFCWKHWFGLTRDMRRALSSTYKAGKKPSKARLELIEQAIRSLPAEPARDNSPTANFADIGWNSPPITARAAVIDDEVIFFTKQGETGTGG